MSFSCRPESHVSKTKEGSHIRPNLRFLSEDIAEICSGDREGTIELVETKQYVIPRVNAAPFLVYKCTDSRHDEVVTSIDYHGGSPFVLVGTNRGDVSVFRERLSVPHPYVEKRVIFRTHDSDPVWLAKFNHLDSGFACAVHTKDDEDSLSVIDLIREQHMDRSLVLADFRTKEKLQDVCWTWRHPALLVASTTKAIRVFDIRSSDHCPQALFLEGPLTMLTPNKFRPEVIAAVNRNVIQLFDTRKLAVPLASYSLAPEIGTFPIDTMKWHPRNPHEVFYSSREAPFIGKLDTSNCKTIQKIRVGGALSKDEIISMERVWDFHETDVSYVESIVKRRNELFPVMDSPVPVLTYGQQFDVCLKNNNEEMPMILNPIRSYRSVVVGGRYRQMRPIRIGDEVESYSPFPGEASQDNACKETSTQRGAGNVKGGVKMYSFVNDAGIEAKSSSKEMQRRASLQMVFNGVPAIQPNKYYEKYQQISENANVHVTMVVESQIEENIVYQTTDRTASPVISRKNQSRRPSENSPEIKALREDKKKCIYWDPMKALRMLDLPEEIMDEALEELQAILPSGTSISVDAVNSLATMAISKLRAIYYGKGALTGAPVTMGIDAIDGYRLSTLPETFAFPGYGFSGVTFLQFGPCARIQFVGSIMSEEEVIVPSDYARTIEDIRLHELYMLTPPGLFNIFARRLKRLDIHPKNVNHIDLLTYLHGGEDVADPWWLLWATGSAHFYESPIRNKTLAAVLRKQKKKEIRVSKVPSRLTVKTPPKAMPTSSALSNSKSKSSGSGTDKSTKANRRVSFTIKPTIFPSSSPSMPAFYKRKTERDMPLPVESDEKLPLRGFLRAVPNNRSRRRRGVRKDPRIRHNLVKNKQYKEEVREHTAFDLEIKGFPGLLQLADLEIAKNVTKPLFFDAVCIEHVELFQSPFRTRMLIPFRIAASDNITRKLRPDAEGIYDYLEVMYCSLLNGKFSIFVQAVEEIGKVFAVPNTIGNEYSRHALFFKEFLAITRQFIKHVVEVRPKASTVETADISLPWLEELDKFFATHHDLLYKDYVLVVPCLTLLRLEVVSSQQPDDVTEKIMLLKKLPFHFRLLWVIRASQPDNLRTRLLKMFQKMKGLDRLIFVGLGRHNDSLNVLSDYLHETRDYQVVAHLVLAGRILEQDEHWISVVSDIVLAKSTVLPKPGTTSPKTPPPLSKLKEEFQAKQAALEKEKDKPKEEKLKRMEPWMFKSFHIFSMSTILKKYFYKDDMAGRRKVLKHLQRKGRLPPLSHMSDVFHNKYVPGIVAGSTLFAVARMAVSHYFLFLLLTDAVIQETEPHEIRHSPEPLPKFDQGGLFRFYLIKLSGNCSFHHPVPEKYLLEVRCQFCGVTRTTPLKPKEEEPPEAQKRRDVITARASARRQDFEEARDKRREMGEPVDSYVPHEDIGGTMVSSEAEMKGPPAHVCPNCAKSWGRCMVCQRVDRLNWSHKSDEDHVGMHFVVCMKCHHGGHMKHIHDWFRKASECAVNGCSCKCYRKPKGETLRLWIEEDMGFRPTATFEY